MSRKGKVPIEIPEKVKAIVDARKVSIEGPNGKLHLDVPSGINIEQNDKNLIVTRANNVKQNRANHGTVRANLANMIVGVTTGHKKDLELQGIGIRAQLQGTKIVFSLGFSHPVEFLVPKDVKVTIPNQTSISIEGANCVLVGLIASKIRDLKPVEPYKGKGIRYLGEIVRRKQGKSVAK